jgi:predicted Zn-dependent peptidase
LFYDRTTLGNGITVLSEPMDTVRSVALGIWIAVGSRDEPPADAGMSHFLEHMMFKGTPTRSAVDISSAFDRMGGELNAFTSKEYTCYYARVLDENVPKALEILGDMVAHSLIAEEHTRQEREVVLEEIARAEDTPDDHIHDIFAEALWPDHPLGRPVLGLRDTVGAFDPTATRAYMDGRYASGNVVVAAAGNIEHGALAELSGRCLADVQPGTGLDRHEASAPVAARLDVVTKETEQAHICYGTTAFNSRSDDRFVLSVLDSVLGGGMASRLFQEIREKRGLAYAVFSYHGLYLDNGQMCVYAGTRPSNVEEVLTIVKQQLELMASDGITDEELDRAKQSIKGSLVLGLESTRNRMTRLGKSEITHGEILSLDELVDRVDAVTRDDVLRVARDLFGRERVLTAVGPMKEDSLAHLMD